MEPVAGSNNIYMALDLEMAQPSERIIEVGIAFGDISTGEVLGSRSIYVNPHEQLTQYIINLTGITQEQVDTGISVQEAFKIVQEEVKKYNAQTQGRVLTWGHGDVGLLKQQVGIDEPGLGMLFGRRYIDVKTIFQSWRLATHKPLQGGLAKSLLKVGLKFDGRKHSAASDSLNTFRMFCALLKKFRE